jgi:hypothetical protein
MRYRAVEAAAEADAVFCCEPDLLSVTFSPYPHLTA